MSIDLIESLDAINRSDALSRTESEESTRPRPERDDHVAQLPFVPQRARLMPKGLPVYLSEPLHIDVSQFLVGHHSRAVPGQAKPGGKPLEIDPIPGPLTHRLGGNVLSKIARKVQCAAQCAMPAVVVLGMNLLESAAALTSHSAVV